VSAAAPTVEAVVAAAGRHVPRLMTQVEDRLAVLTGGHGPLLSRHAGETIAAGGKRLRPLLVIVAAGEAAAAESARVVAAAAAVELVHSATLVHDDVLDDAPLRRGRPTVLAAGGRAMATATGDLLFSRAFAELAQGGDAEDLRILSAAASDLARGEQLQRADAWDAEVTEERYRLRCELKTARLFQAACRLGARHGPGASAEAALGEFGRRIGLAFQLLDDVLDVSGPPERTGKARGTDLLDGTVTLPLIRARRRDPALAALDLRTVRDPARAREVCEAIAATGALEEARAAALELVAAAKREMPALGEAQRRALGLVADGVVARYR